MNLIFIIISFFSIMNFYRSVFIHGRFGAAVKLNLKLMPLSEQLKTSTDVLLF